MIQRTAEVSEEVNRKCPGRNTTVQLSTPTLRHRQTDRRHDNAKSRSYCMRTRYDWLKIIQLPCVCIAIQSSTYAHTRLQWTVIMVPY